MPNKHLISAIVVFRSGASASEVLFIVLGHDGGVHPVQDLTLESISCDSRRHGTTTGRESRRWRRDSSLDTQRE